MEAHKSDFLAVAKLGAARGLDGSLRLVSYSGAYSHIEAVREILVGGEAGLADATSMRIKRVNVGGWGASIVFEGYETPEAARKLVGRELFLPRSEACPKGEGEYYIADLVGMRVTVDGRLIGSISAVIEGNADDLLEVRKMDGTTSLVPFRKEFVGTVDEEKGGIEIVSPWILE